MLKNIISIILIIIIILISLSCYYFTIAYANSGSFTGTLINAEVIIKTSCSNNKKGAGCTQTYYVGETFKKDNSTNTCLVTRLQPFYFEGAANNVAEHKELYTTRKIWTTWYSSGTCYDKTIRSYYTSIAVVLSGLTTALLIGLIFVSCTFKDESQNIAIAENNLYRLTQIRKDILDLRKGENVTIQQV